MAASSFGFTLRRPMNFPSIFFLGVRTLDGPTRVWSLSVAEPQASSMDHP
jgi:hypothetical protein